MYVCKMDSYMLELEAPIKCNSLNHTMREALEDESRRKALLRNVTRIL
jgi:hypothetical protein